MKNKRSAQSLAEYAILVAVVLAVFMAMQTYMKRGIQWVIHDNIEDFGPQYYTSLRKEDSSTFEQKNSSTFDIHKGTIYESQQTADAKSGRINVLLPEGANKNELPEESNTTVTTGKNRYFQGAEQIRF